MGIRADYQNGYAFSDIGLLGDIRPASVAGRLAVSELCVKLGQLKCTKRLF